MVMVMAMARGDGDLEDDTFFYSFSAVTAAICLRNLFTIYSCSISSLFSKSIFSLRNYTRNIVR